MSDTLKIGGHFRYEIVGVDGKVRARGVVKNGIPNAALSDVLRVYFQSSTVRTTFYLAPIDVTSYTALAAADTAASHAGWTEGTQYSEATRPAWSPATESNQTLANTTPVTLTVNALCTWVGFFVATTNTKSGTTGLLWATGLLDSSQVLNSGETAKLYYTLAAASG